MHVVTLGMFLAFRRSSTSKRISMETPNSKRSLIILSILSFGDISSWDTTDLFLFCDPSGVG